MKLIRGWYENTGLTGTMYEPNEDAPEYTGDVNSKAPYVWVCDSFYQVESGGRPQRIEGTVINVAFDPPVTRGFESEEDAIKYAKEHIRTQFSRLGVDGDRVTFEIEQPPVIEN